MVQLRFIRSLARFFLDTKIDDKNQINPDELVKQHTLDELYKLVHPDWSNEQLFLLYFFSE